ncbi:MAG: WecB/TagA/CpsF family glycosyltransferase [Nitrosomonadales bacterium]|nr:WecB/TagA/CpsF family glycosyltransferase [Nitrosomonadales bacterium]
MPANFDREVHCLLGLPFDAVSMAGAAKSIRAAAENRIPCFLSTPNLNFLVAAQSDIAFRNSVINSDLSIADGMPLIWIARLLGVPIRERVAGSALFETLRSGSVRQITIYFFGGPNGVAENACRRLNAEAGGLRCVGFDSPGFGSVDEMSSEAVLQRINDSNPEFLVVSLGARKGQAWIERNRSRISAPVISHLGAVVNFVAGTVKRAPVWMQKVGLEWLWRIKEDPVLWRRYLFDGLALLRLLATRVVPYAWFKLFHKPEVRELEFAAITLFDEGARISIRLRGAWDNANIAPLRECFASPVLAGKDIRIELQDVTYIDSAFIGLMLLLYGDRGRQERQLSIANAKPEVRRIFRYGCAEYLLERK